MRLSGGSRGGAASIAIPALLHGGAASIAISTLLHGGGRPVPPSCGRARRKDRFRPARVGRAALHERGRLGRRLGAAARHRWSRLHVGRVHRLLRRRAGRGRVARGRAGRKERRRRHRPQAGGRCEHGPTAISSAAAPGPRATAVTSQDTAVVVRVRLNGLCLMSARLYDPYLIEEGGSCKTLERDHNRNGLTTRDIAQ